MACTPMLKDMRCDLYEFQASSEKPENQDKQPHASDSNTCTMPNESVSFE